jgi:hypothetical protein
MTDHRVTDLSYGHLGKASYDTDENQWIFSNTKDQGKSCSQNSAGFLLIFSFRSTHPAAAALSATLSALISKCAKERWHTFTNCQLSIQMACKESTRDFSSQHDYFNARKSS